MATTKVVVIILHMPLSTTSSASGAAGGGAMSAWKTFFNFTTHTKTKISRTNKDALQSLVPW